MIEVGRITGLFGVQGWVKIDSYTQPRENLLNYQPWLVKIKGQPPELLTCIASEVHSKCIVVQFKAYESMEAARALIGARIEVKREQLPKLSEGQYYWTDLEGLEVKTIQGASLGKVAYLFATPANDVLVVKGDRERFIPYLPRQVVKHVDLSKMVMIVDWDPEF
ncbi:MAG: ribosome maturation factor RimM [Legionellales bacterium]|jgi:16S rRNA processing protein RimM